MPTSKIDVEMIQTAEYAIKIAREKYGQVLDYSEGSLPRLEMLLEQASQQVKDWNGNIDSITKAKSQRASMWGSFLGELIRKKFGGTWIIEGTHRLLIVNDVRLSPLEYVFQRISGKPDIDVKQWFDGIAEKLSSTSIDSFQFQSVGSGVQNPTNVKKSFFREYLLIIVLGVMIAIMIICFIGWSLLKKIDTSAKATEQASSAIATQQAKNATDAAIKQVQIMEDYFHCRSDSIGNMIITGKVRNTGQQSIVSIVLGAWAIAPDGAIVNNAIGFIDSEVLTPGSTSTFTVYVDNPNSEASDCRIGVIDAKFLP